MQWNKAELRQQMKQLRREQPHKDEVSAAALRRILEMPAYKHSLTILWYLDVRDELRTRNWLLSEGLTQAKSANQTIAIPWCDGSELKLFKLSEAGQLQTGKFGILEPAAGLRAQELYQVLPERIDLAIIPGVAFDKRGGRLGHGAGYYDRLLPQLRKDCLKVGLGYACQVVAEVPCESHDVRMDAIVTENGLLDCPGAL
ncbi:MAG: 5-formyltetrahydrofolate cyclo-ligase [Planctomycetaceae bacterium]